RRGPVAHAIAERHRGVVVRRRVIGPGAVAVVVERPPAGGDLQFDRRQRRIVDIARIRQQLGLRDQARPAVLRNRSHRHRRRHRRIVHRRDVDGDRRGCRRLAIGDRNIKRVQAIDVGIRRIGDARLDRRRNRRLRAGPQQGAVGAVAVAPSERATDRVPSVPSLSLEVSAWLAMASRIAWLGVSWPPLTPSVIVSVSPSASVTCANSACSRTGVSSAVVTVPPTFWITGEAFTISSMITEAALYGVDPPTPLAAKSTTVSLVTGPAESSINRPSSAGASP